MTANPHLSHLTRLEPLLTRLAFPRQQQLGDGLCQLVELVLETNLQFNLTADDEPDLFWTRQVEDSLCAAAALMAELPPPRPGTPLLDVGAGGGIPGLVWGLLWPEALVTLLESRRKRADWLKNASAQLGIAQAAVLAERAEVMGQQPEHREHYGLVTARALARLNVLLELTLPFTRVGGCVAAIKSADCLEEIREAGYALQELGSSPESVHRLPYTRSDGKKCLVLLIPKLRATPHLYPRREGIPKLHPL
jgi:16S rRNA (guanine527-N7)-methyltransferase